jgi:hypothetical protein
VVGTYKETASGVKLDRAERKRVLALVAQGRSYRLVGREVGLSKNTVADIVKRARAQPAHERSNVPGPCRQPCYFARSMARPRPGGIRPGRAALR